MEPFTISEVLGDAWASYRRTWGAHLRWNVGFVALALVSICGVSCVTMPATLLAGGGSQGASVVAVIVLYVLMIVVMLGLFGMHQGVTLEIAAADRRSEAPDVAACVGSAGGRLPSVAGALFLRVLIDTVIGGVLVGVPIALVIGDRAAGGEPPDAAVTGAIGLAMIGGYLVWLGWMLVSRAFVGLSGACAQLEGLGPVAAIARSVQLLSGQRLKAIGLRLVWGLLALVLYVGTYLPLVGVVLASGLVAGAGSEDGAGLVVLLLLPFALLWYLFVLHLVSFDTLIEGALHARLTQTKTAEDIADVFA